jgi:hypothetical protein
MVLKAEELMQKYSPNTEQDKAETRMEKLGIIGGVD